MGDTAQSRITLRDLDHAIGPGKQVTLHFALRLSGGEPIDSNFDRAPVTFVIGDGSMLPGFEQALSGLVAGDRREVTLQPEQAFGPVNDDNVQRFPHYQFAPDLALTPGLMIEFADAAGNKQAGVVRSVDKQWVEVDFNHPLAGRALLFSVHVHAVTERT